MLTVLMVDHSTDYMHSFSISWSWSEIWKFIVTLLEIFGICKSRTTRSPWSPKMRTKKGQELWTERGMLLKIVWPEYLHLPVSDWVGSLQHVVVTIFQDRTGGSCPLISVMAWCLQLALLHIGNKCYFALFSWLCCSTRIIGSLVMLKTPLQLH